MWILQCTTRGSTGAVYYPFFSTPRINIIIYSLRVKRIRLIFLYFFALSHENELCSVWFCIAGALADIWLCIGNNWKAFTMKLINLQFNVYLFCFSCRSSLQSLFPARFSSRDTPVSWWAFPRSRAVYESPPEASGLSASGVSPSSSSCNSIYFQRNSKSP